jgi:hypothetical protein
VVVYRRYDSRTTELRYYRALAIQIFSCLNFD